MDHNFKAGGLNVNQTTNYLIGIRRIIKLHESMLKESVCREYTLTLTEATVISFLYNNPGKDTAADIVELRMLQKGNVSQAVESLVKKSLLIRKQDAEDRRKIHLSLTDKAEPVVEMVERVCREFHEEVFYGITPEKLHTFSEVNEQMEENVRKAIEKRG